ncbi:uncharacterized protein LOC119079604 [Bradysia coprophila]|uniref:uncharacterized protein LOC119079604 n=1 Tax=Bradysia coprophila TaxID=38358 RepID=UPI00187DAA55|nr:uncharacterized protein LOC119079604 [Bradysia coprophila]
MSSETETESNHNKMQLACPWINSSLFEELLRKDFPASDIIVHDYRLKPALARGENYASQMIRAEVNYSMNGENKQIRFIIKAALAKDALKQLSDEMKGIFYTEIAMYNDVLTKVHDLLKASGEKISFYGRCYASSRENAYLIFEDLTDRGFRNVDRRIGLDISHCKLVLSTLAKYHAATAVLVEKEPSLKKHFDQHGTVTGSDFIRKLVSNFLIAQAEFCKKQPGLEKLAEKFNIVKDTIYDRIAASCARDDNDLNVILHGDVWSNNIMFKYGDNGEVEDTVLVDFQICYYGPPVLDVTYCLYTSSHIDVSESDWDMLVQYYYEELRSTLAKLNYQKKVPSLTEFNVQIILRGMYAASMGIITQSSRMLENVSENGLADLIRDDKAEHRLNMLLNPKVIPTIIKLLKYFDRRGYYEGDDFQY